ncbi:cell division protein FtsL [Bacillus sp. B1-b2]|uniref:cell division protein FtsL n=1 Tax=Bacillus sp. B1-b2 TaxID=2653201 RepID=UPI001261E56F|nr:cell division protein FtsL [Bacillus sp. B1-b2]KAB7669270.1 cell division protein FtsL [Bacillus sp. B1-b2]
MSNLARKMQQESIQQQEVKSIKKVTKHAKSLLSPGEKILGVTCAALICLGGVTIISNQSKIYDVNKEIQTTQSSIAVLEKSNKELDAQISNLSNFERLREVAEKLGLDFSKDNVKVVQ